MARGAYKQSSFEAQSPAQGELLLIAAIFDQALRDARGEWASTSIPSARALLQAEARAFLRDTAAVGFWCGLTGADAAIIQPALLRAAGLDR